MTQTTTHTLGDGSLVELLDRLLETGVTASGDLLLGLADVDLIRVSLRVALGSVDTLAPDAPPRVDQTGRSAPARPLPELELTIPPDRAELGIGGLLVAVIEIVHGLLERQAIHRMEHGSLTSEQTERLGQALMALDNRIRQLIELFSAHPTPELPVAITGAAH
jgi:hypothetical protein